MKPIKLAITRVLGCALSLLIAAGQSALAQSVRVVNMIPASQSNETSRDAEPNVAVNPANPLQIAATAFTPDPMASGNSPIFASIDGGVSWNLNSIILPGAGCASNATCDATVRFAGSSGILYAGIIRGDNVHLNILRTNNYLANVLMTTLVDRANEDQPWVQATTVLELAGTGNDRVYVGNNDLSLRINNGGNGKTATVDASLDAATAPPPAGFNPDRAEARATSNQDGPPNRTAVHLDGTVYAAYYGFRNAGTDVVVARDDNWATGPNPFTSLSDLNDAQMGQRVVTGIVVSEGGLLGNQRVGSQLAVAVDPNNSRTVYVAWADGAAANQTLHVRNSTDGGQHWSADLRTASPATNPALAVNSHGKVGFLYQRHAGHGWQTHLERTTDAFTNVADLVLADVPDQLGNYAGQNPIGDYDNLIAIGKDFYGVFSAFNTPDNGNFPSGVTYQRFADFGSHQLFADMAHTMVVQPSIDPFFFQVAELAPDQDFYVRDWTDTIASHDQGQEPSTKPDFWDLSDVWNRASNNAGAPNGNDQFSTDPMQAGIGALGDNFAFLRVHRNATGSAAVVSAHFLVSPFGTGSSFQDAGVAVDPTLNFGANDSTQTLASGYPWHQDATMSTHACIAVQITGPNDPFIPPGLLGSTPGWPSGIAIVEDNNKAQRNLEVNNAMIDNGAIDYALIHNAATFTRNLQLRYEAPPALVEKLRGARIDVVGGPSLPFKSGDTITLENVQPGENRWIGLALTVPRGDAVPVNFFEIVNDRAVNGFTILTRPVTVDLAIRDNIKSHTQAFNRLAAAFRVKHADAEGKTATRLLDGGNPTEGSYMDFLKLHAKNMGAVLDNLIEKQKSTDAFAARQTLATLSAAIGAGNSGQAASAHSILLHQLDGFTTMLQKAQGDPADILQMVRWQRELYSTVPQLKQLKRSAYVVSESQEFINSFGKRRPAYDDYSRLLRELIGSFQETEEALEKQQVQVQREVTQIKRHLSSITALEKAHRNYLLKLQGLAAAH